MWRCFSPLVVVLLHRGTWSHAADETSPHTTVRAGEAGITALAAGAGTGSLFMIDQKGKLAEISTATWRVAREKLLDGEFIPAHGSIAVRRDGAALAISGFGDAVYLLDTRDWKSLTRKRVGAPAMKVVYAPDTDVLLCETPDSIHTLGGRDAEIIRTLKKAERSSDSHLCVSADSKFFAWATSRRLRVCRRADGELHHQVAIGGKEARPWFDAVAFSPGGDLLLYAHSGECAVKLLAMGTGKVVGELDLRKWGSAVDDVVFLSPDRVLVSATALRIRNLKTNEWEAALKRRAPDVSHSCITVTAGGKQLAVGGSDGKISIYRLTD